jgi:gamma-glutamyl phosphate reductase
MDTETLVAQIKSGTYDASLTKLKEAIEERLKASRGSRTLSDYNIGDTVVFNELTGTRYMVGQKATIISMKQKKVVVRLETPMGRFARVNNLTGKVESANVTVPLGIIDLVN